jgi:type 1 fimbriae regulatory protein FimB
MTQPLPANVLTIPVKKPRSTKRGKLDFLTPDELLAVLRVAHEHSTRSWAMILVAYKHGLRASEVCGLKLADINIKNGTISAERLKGSLHTIQQLMPQRGQPLLDEIAALKEWLRIRPADAGDSLFTSQKGGHLSRGQFFAIFRDIAERAGLPASKRHPHCLKHSLATHLISAKTNLAVVGQYLGHKSISSTMKYISVSDRQASDAARDALQNIF